MAVLQADYLKGHDCETAPPAMQKQEGCHEPKPEHECWYFEGLKFERCPAYYVNRAAAWIRDAFQIYAWADKGLLPFPGTWLDQPSKIIDVLEIIGALITKKADDERRATSSKTPTRR